MKINARNLVCALVLTVATAGIVNSQSMELLPPDVLKASTAPSKRVQMNFPGIGVVKTVPVKEGQAVKTGDVLMVQDTDIDRDELERLKVEADSTARMEFSKADKELKKSVYERLLPGKGAFSPVELEQAKLDWDRAEAQIKVVQEEQQGSAIKVKQQQTKITKMTLNSTVDGVVESILAHEGTLSSLDTDKPAVIVVQNDPLRVVITLLRTAQVAKLQIGEAFLNVRYYDETEWREAKVTYKTPFADASSDRQAVWLELPNPQHRDAGLPIQVKLPAKLLTGTDAPRISATPR